MSKPNSENCTYLGDGVYGCHYPDVGQIAISLGSHDSEPSVWLEPEVLANLVRFGKDKGMIA